MPQAQLRDPAKYLQEAVSDLASTGQLHGALRVPAAVAPIKVTADLRAGLIHCAITVPAPREGRPTTRVNWLVRQLKNAPGKACIQASTAWQRGRGPARTLNEARTDPKSLVESSEHELRSFTLSLSSDAGPARGQGRGSFVNSVLAAVEKFYTDVVQHIKPWAAAPPKVRDSEAPPVDGPIPSEGIAADAHDHRTGDEAEAVTPAGWSQT